MERDAQEVTNDTSDYTDNDKPSHWIHSELKTGVMCMMWMCVCMLIDPIKSVTKPKMRSSDEMRPSQQTHCHQSSCLEQVLCQLFNGSCNDRHYICMSILNVSLLMQVIVKPCHGSCQGGTSYFYDVI